MERMETNPLTPDRSRERPSFHGGQADDTKGRAMTNCMLVIPCFNEEARLDRAAFLSLAQAPHLSLLFVDDGSSDGTARVLEQLCAQAPKQIHVLILERNVGKGEAVRRGMLEALSRGVDIVGFADADLATPPDELVRLRDELIASDLSVAVGSRVLLMGTDIKRHLWRHLVGRLFATFAATILEMPFYDTQCGAKYFRDTPTLRAALSSPFVSRWVFDIELLGRLYIGTGEIAGIPMDKFREITLRRWVDVADSKLSLPGMTKALLDLPVIDRELTRLRAAARTPGAAPASRTDAA
jgi:dolichyl-phosphate beta-glucosyltransferase